MSVKLSEILADLPKERRKKIEERVKELETENQRLWSALDEGNKRVGELYEENKRLREELERWRPVIQTKSGTVTWKGGE